jgi:hypothetical protein
MYPARVATDNVRRMYRSMWVREALEITNMAENGPDA